MKKLKFLLPLLAFVMAIGLAFAMEANRTAPTGYYDDPLIPGIQEVPTDCSPIGTKENCFYNGYQLYDEPELVTPLKRL